MFKLENSKIKIINRITTRLADLYVREDDILTIRFKIEEYEIDLNDQLDIQEAILNLTNQGRLSYHLLVIPGRYNSITKEAREKDSFQSNVYKNQRSMAVVTHNLAQRILANAFFTFKKSKPPFPFRLFDTEIEAIKWIKRLDQEN